SASFHSFATSTSIPLYLTLGMPRVSFPYLLACAIVLADSNGMDGSVFVISGTSGKSSTCPAMAHRQCGCIGLAFSPGTISLTLKTLSSKAAHISQAEDSAIYTY